MVAPHFLLLSALLMAVPTTGVRVILSSSLSPTTVYCSDSFFGCNSAGAVVTAEDVVTINDMVSADEEVTAQQRDDSGGLTFDANNIQTLDNADPNCGLILLATCICMHRYIHT
jgi:hypothetical protein